MNLIYLGLLMNVEVPLKGENSFLENPELKSDQQTRSQFIAKSAEHLVLSILLSRGFNAGIVSVDEGADIVAVRRRKLYSIQVKSKGIDRGRYAFAIPKNTFGFQDPLGSFYVFVLRNKATHATHFLIVPHVIIKKAVKNGLISEVSKRRRAYYQFVIAQTKRGFFLKSRKSGPDWSKLEDCWDQLN